MRGLRQFLFRWQNLLGILIVGVFVAMAVSAPHLTASDNAESPQWIRAVERIEGTSRRVPLPPGPGIPLGTTAGGYDIFYSLLWGARSALGFGLAVASITAMLGTFIGAMSAYFGGLAHRLTLRVIDAFLTFPPIAAVWLLAQVMRPPEVLPPGISLQAVLAQLRVSPVMLALILFSWMPYARIIGAEVLGLKHSEYVEAARSLGAGHFRLIFRHLLPNAISPAIVLLARDIGGMVILQAAFHFIGLGGMSPWSWLLVNGRNWILGPNASLLTYWWVYLPATLALVIFGIGWNLLGDGLNEALNPRFYNGPMRWGRA
ncbi:MAG: ABC transporter permease [Anaerolineae bacterium]|nr:ABC transporter permease [Anaerolineae bacterium]